MILFFLLPLINSIRISDCSTPVIIVDPLAPPVKNKCYSMNEVYSGNISPCGNTCENYGSHCNIFTYVPVKGCDCIAGFARLVDKGECVSLDDPRCIKKRCSKPNEVYSVNISPCGNTCENYGQLCTIVNKKAVTGCDCIKGYARLGQYGQCVKIDSPQCIRRYPPSAVNCALKPNEEFIKNSYDCQTLCETVLAGPCTILSLLPISDCYCKRGYARIEGGGACVPICSKNCLRKVKSPESCGE